VADGAVYGGFLTFRMHVQPCLHFEVVCVVVHMLDIEDER
jgi:hypothetical protein